MRDLLRLLEVGLDMGGTDRAWYDAQPGISADMAKTVRAMRDQGMRWIDIGEALGMSHEPLRRRFR